MTIAVLSSKGMPRFSNNKAECLLTGFLVDRVISSVKKVVEAGKENFFAADMDKELPKKLDIDGQREIDYISEPLSKADAVIFVVSLSRGLERRALSLSLDNYRRRELKKQIPCILIGCADSNTCYESNSGIDDFEIMLQDCGIIIADRFLVTGINESYMMTAVSSSVSMLSANYDNFSSSGIKDNKRYREWLNLNGRKAEREKQLEENIDILKQQIDILKQQSELQNKLIEGKDNVIHILEEISQAKDEMIAAKDEKIAEARKLLTNNTEILEKAAKELSDMEAQRTEHQRSIVSKYEAAVLEIENGEYERAAEILRDALEPVLSDDQYKWGVFYVNGEGIEVDYLKALFWFEKAAAQDHAGANRAIGIFYINGIGVEVDYEAALPYLNRAAELGSANALVWLGLCYINGWGVEGDDEKAFSFYERAANKGDMEGVRLMGACYEDGSGIEKDLDKALELYRKAAEGGDERALQDLEELQKAMSETEESPENE